MSSPHFSLGDWQLRCVTSRTLLSQNSFYYLLVYYEIPLLRDSDDHIAALRADDHEDVSTLCS